MGSVPFSLKIVEGGMASVRPTYLQFEYEGKIGTARAAPIYTGLVYRIDPGFLAADASGQADISNLSDASTTRRRGSHRIGAPGGEARLSTYCRRKSGVA